MFLMLMLFYLIVVSFKNGYLIFYVELLLVATLVKYVGSLFNILNFV